MFERKHFLLYRDEYETISYEGFLVTLKWYVIKRAGFPVCLSVHPFITHYQ